MFFVGGFFWLSETLSGLQHTNFSNPILQSRSRSVDWTLALRLNIFFWTLWKDVLGELNGSQTEPFHFIQPNKAALFDSPASGDQSIVWETHFIFIYLRETLVCNGTSQNACLWELILCLMNANFIYCFVELQNGILLPEEKNS